MGGGGEAVKLACGRPVLAPAAFKWPAVDVVSVELADGHGGVFMCVHFDEGEAAVRLETRFGDVAKILEQWDQIVLSGVGCQVADVDGGLPLRGLLHDHLVRLGALGWEGVVAESGGWGHAHRGHGLLLGEGRLALLIGPVAADGTRAQPLAVHGGKRLLGVGALAESDEAVAARAAGLHVPHDARFGHGAVGNEGLQQHLIVDLVREIADKDVEVIGRVFFSRVVGLIRPVDADLLLVHTAAVERLHGAFGTLGVIVLDEAVVVALGLELQFRQGVCS